jgi:hypothetical protein
VTFIDYTNTASIKHWASINGKPLRPLNKQQAVPSSSQFEGPPTLKYSEILHMNAAANFLTLYKP